jgi:hypothetical protein
VTAKLEFFVTARRIDASGSVATCKDATLTLDTALAGRRDALNPNELLLAASGTVFNTLAPGTDLKGVLVRRKVTST